MTTYYLVGRLVDYWYGNLEPHTIRVYKTKAKAIRYMENNGYHMLVVKGNE